MFAITLRGIKIDSYMACYKETTSSPRKRIFGSTQQEPPQPPIYRSHPGRRVFLHLLKPISSWRRQTGDPHGRKSHMENHSSTALCIPPPREPVKRSVTTTSSTRRRSLQQFSSMLLLHA